MPRRAFASVLAVLAAFSAGACDGSPTSPGEVPGTYVLHSVNGDPLPAVATPIPGATVYLEADSLRLSPDGTGSEVVVHRTVYGTPGQPDEIERTELRLQHELRDGRVEITYLCPPDALALCMPGPHALARATDGWLIVSSRADVYRFRRVD